VEQPDLFGPKFNAEQLMQVQMKKALVACLPDPSGNPRPNRVIRLLHGMNFQVDSLSLAPKSFFEGLQSTFSIKPDATEGLSLKWSKLLYYAVYLGGILKFPIWYFNIFFSFIYGLNRHRNVLRKISYDLIIVEDLNLLPFVFHIKGNNTKIIFDAREYYPKERDESSLFRKYIAPYRILFCSYFLKKLDGFYTVSEGLADMYETDFGIRPEVIRSTPVFQQEPNPKPVSFPMKMVHHGGASSNRQLENMIDIVRTLNGKYTLDFYLTGDLTYRRYLEAYAQDCSFVSFKEPVKFTDIHKMLTLYDIGFCYMSTDVTNTMYSLPNKFFEYVQARLVLAINPAPDMVKIAKNYGMAVIAEDFSNLSMINALDKLDIEEYNALKDGVKRAARDLCWEQESKKFVSLVLKIDHSS
jgi:hypothetical protein